jgi:POT family proton-dependent oligopeptide transporter
MVFQSFLFLAFVELWERFSAYTLSYLLPIYTWTPKEMGGLGFSESIALKFSGYYFFALWSAPVIGGYIADKVLSPKQSLFMGAIFIVLGHALILINQPIIFFPISLICIVLCVGLFKPSITSIIGEIFKNRPHFRERAYNYYYISINLGILFSGLISGIVAHAFGFRYAFSLGGFGMLLALLLLYYKKSTISFVGNRHSDFEFSLKKQFEYFAGLKPYLPRLSLVYLCSLFWGASYFLGIGGTLISYINQYTDRRVLGYEIPLTWFPSINPVLLILLTFILVFFWKILKKTGYEFRLELKMGLGLFFSFSAFLLITVFSSLLFFNNDLKLGMGLILLFYGFSVLGELLTCPVSYTLISETVPKEYKSICQALCFFSYGLGGLIAGEIGGRSKESEAPFQIFISASIVFFAFVVIYTIFLFKTQRIILKHKEHNLLL